MAVRIDRRLVVVAVVSLFAIAAIATAIVRSGDSTDTDTDTDLAVPAAVMPLSDDTSPRGMAQASTTAPRQAVETTATLEARNREIRLTTDPSLPALSDAYMPPPTAAPTTAATSAPTSTAATATTSPAPTSTAAPTTTPPAPTSTAAPTTTSPAPTSTAAPTTTPPGPTSTAALATGDRAFEQRVIDLTNANRRQNGCRDLTNNSKLHAAALGHSADMNAKGYFSHTSADGSSMSNRIDRQGYGWRSIAENIARGQRTPEQVVEGWMNSPGHRANILNCGHTEIGVGFVNYYWTQNFGTPR